MSQTTLEVVLSTRIYLYVASLEATPRIMQFLKKK
jgi:hypothetical protein